MPDFRSTETDRIEVRVGQTFRLESLRQAVVPPFVMLMPFIDLPDFLTREGEEPPFEDGIHGSVFVLQATKAGTGSLRVGFRDLQTDAVTHEKTIAVEAR